jgi:glycine oxidase
MQVTIIGGGVAGLSCGVELAERGAGVELLERSAALGVDSCSWCAAGMLAPWSEQADGCESPIVELGVESIALWRQRFPELCTAQGTLVIAAGRDLPDLKRFAQRAEHGRWCEREHIAALEPELAERFERAVYLTDEAHLDPREVLPALAARLQALGGTIRYGVSPGEADLVGRRVVDCRGLGARTALPELRGVRGEVLLLDSRELHFTRPIRLLHPRVPIYLVPRGNGVYLLGATVIENEDIGPVTVRSALELLSAAYALHPAFAEAQILEMRAQTRPAFPDNLPQIRRSGQRLYVNGLYRHGFLLAPALAVRVAQILLHNRHFPELSHEDRCERRLA